MELKIRLQNAGHDPHGVVFSRVPFEALLDTGYDSIPPRSVTPAPITV